jgi:hypothetical protein
MTPKRQDKSQLSTTMVKPSLFSICLVGGTNIKGKTPKRAEIRAVYSKGKNAESELNPEMTQEISKKTALSRSTIPT